jgi:hypothetical protein
MGDCVDAPDGNGGEVPTGGTGASAAGGGSTDLGGLSGKGGEAGDGGAGGTTGTGGSGTGRRPTRGGAESGGCALVAGSTDTRGAGLLVLGLALTLWRRRRRA